MEITNTKAKIIQLSDEQLKQAIWEIKADHFTGIVETLKNSQKTIFPLTIREIIDEILKQGAYRFALNQLTGEIK